MPFPFVIGDQKYKLGKTLSDMMAPQRAPWVGYGLDRAGYSSISCFPVMNRFSVDLFLFGTTGLSSSFSRFLIIPSGNLMAHEAWSTSGCGRDPVFFQALDSGSYTKTPSSLFIRLKEPPPVMKSLEWWVVILNWQQSKGESLRALHWSVAGQ